MVLISVLLPAPLGPSRPVIPPGILTEKLLLKNGFYAKKVAPSPKYRKGCEISVEINLSNQKEIIQLLKKHNINHQGIVPV